MRVGFLLFAKIHFHMYRVFFQSVQSKTWESLTACCYPNLKLLRDIGYKHTKGRLEKVPPVDGVLVEMFAQSIFQAHEYGQIFDRFFENLEPNKFGFEKCEGVFGQG